MSQIVTMTEFLRDPKRVREMVAKGIKVYVKFEGKIVMVITFPESPKISKKMPNAKVEIDVSNITKDDIYSRDSWLDKD